MSCDGLIAATYTPLHRDGSVHWEQIPALCEFLRHRQRVNGLYVCGSTGEGVSLSCSEREQVAAAYIEAVDGNLPVIIQVGHNSLSEARRLASHAASLGATAISANAPSYFKVLDTHTLVQSMQVVAEGAPDLPFFYYHIPHLTGAQVDMVAFLRVASECIPNLAGIKFTSPALHEFRACRTEFEGRFEVLWGSDEMLLAALAMGAQGAVGSTYNIIAPLFHQVMKSFREADLTRAQAYQDRCNLFIRTLYRYPFHAAMKAVLRELGLDCGACRLPLASLTADDEKQLFAALENMDFFSWLGEEVSDA